VIAYVAAIYRERIPYMPGAEQAVALAQRLLPTGLASGSDRRLIETVLQDEPMRGKFQVVACADEQPRGKPAPDVYLEAARLLGVAPENCVCLEDSKNGILAGKAAGMKVIAVPDARFAQPPEILRQADVVLPSLLDFSEDVLRSLEAA
jgi:HAD superfamily hydrolase (TIGR01509 family)